MHSGDASNTVARSFGHLYAMNDKRFLLAAVLLEVPVEGEEVDARLRDAAGGRGDC